MMIRADSSPALFDSSRHSPILRVRSHLTPLSMPKPTSPRHPSKDSLQSVTKKDDDELVEKKMDQKLDEKFNPVITKLDAVLKEFQDHRDEDIAGAEQLRRHDDQLQDHAVRIKALEAIRNP